MVYGVWYGKGEDVVGAGDYSHDRFGKKKSMQYVLLETQQTTEQCVVIVLNKLSCCWPVSWIQTRTLRRTIASIRCRLSAIVKPHQTMDA